MPMTPACPCPELMSRHAHWLQACAARAMWAVPVVPELTLQAGCWPPSRFTQLWPPALAAHQEGVLPQFMVRNNFYVLIDNHFEDTTITTAPDQWVSYWTGLITDIVKDPASTGRVLVDLYNEPDSHGLTWETVRPCLPARLWGTC